MRKIEEIDKNFAVKKVVIKEGTRIYNVCELPFSIHGVFSPSDKLESFHRMDPIVAKDISDGVNALNTNCAGGRVRFKTDSSYIAVKAVMGEIGKLPHCALTGTSGFDLYSGTEHITTFQPMFNITDEVFGEYIREDCGLKEYTLNFPLYSAVKELYVILDGDAVLERAEPYQNGKPMVFYGSSITQGGCASRPGTSYPSVISRRFDLDYINLGFAGNARGEEAMADYIAGLDMSIFVYDYDHNAPTVEHLDNTHEKFFKIIRNAHPDIPVICMTRPFPCPDDYIERKRIVKKTVLNARANGDKNIYFIDMAEYFSKKGVLNEATVDKCHPNDLGFFVMAEAIENTMKEFIL